VNVLKKLSALCVLFSLLIYGSAQDVPKYIFYMIGDGMGPVQVQAADGFLRSKGDSVCFMSFPVMHTISTHAANRAITGSAAAGTALATGVKTNIGAIGVDIKDEPLTTVAEKAYQNKMGVGIVSSVFINHATPAAFYAKNSSRDNYYAIGADLPKSGFHFFGGGSIKNASKQKDVYEIAAENAYSVVTSLSEINPKNDNAKYLALSDKIDQTSTVRNVIDEDESTTKLAEYTTAALYVLGAHKNGFFLMVEGGKIDWMCHSNDYASAVREVEGFNDAVKQAVNFYDKNPDETLIIVTADHETGGLGLGSLQNPYNLDYSIAGEQKISGEKFTRLIEQKNKAEFTVDSLYLLLKEKFGFNGKKIKLNSADSVVISKAYNSYFKSNSASKESEYYKGDIITETVLKIMDQKAGVGWTTGSHTAAQVPMYVKGKHADLFANCSDNTDIAKVIISLLEDK